MDDERAMEIRVRAITTAEAITKVLQWSSLARDKVLAVRYERQRVIRYECSSKQAYDLGDR